LVLRGDGLGIVSFGDPVDDVASVLTDRLGPPSYDRVEESPFDTPLGDNGPDACHYLTGFVCFNYIRFVSWEDSGLWVTFTDLEVNETADPGSDDYWLQVPPSLRGYDYWAGDAGSSAQTPQGITIGSTVTDLQALGEAVRFHSDACGEIVGFSIADPESVNDGFIRGSLDGADWEAFLESGYLNPAATVWHLDTGAQSSC
jgi:hypothetical protein